MNTTKNYYFLIVDDETGEITTGLGCDEQGRDVHIPEGCSLYDCLPYYTSTEALEAYQVDQAYTEDDRMYESTRQTDYYRDPDPDLDPGTEDRRCYQCDKGFYLDEFGLCSNPECENYEDV